MRARHARVRTSFSLFFISFSHLDSAFPAGESSAKTRFFDDEAADLVDFHRTLLTETPSDRAWRIDAGREWLRTHHDSATEARALRVAYERVI